MMNNIIQEALRQLSEEDIQEIRTVDNSELDDEGIDVTEEDLKFEQTMIEFFNELNQDIDLTEDFKTTTSIKYHFNQSLRRTYYVCNLFNSCIKCHNFTLCYLYFSLLHAWLV